MILLIIIAAVLFLAYANGANDNFKGVASLYGAKITSYRTALRWATTTTFLGSMTALFVAHSMLAKFSGKGLVPDALTKEPIFLFAVALSAGITVYLATKIGFPISTTHALIGALVGSGWAAIGNHISLQNLGKSFILPLILSPLLAIALGAFLYFLFQWIPSIFRDKFNHCLCAEESHILAHHGSSLTAQVDIVPHLHIGSSEKCSDSNKVIVQMNASKIADAIHFLSAGLVSFARGLNDTPKMAALLLIIPAVTPLWIISMVAILIALGGILSARKVAETMSHRITTLNPQQGLCSNLSTGTLVILASTFGLPVSTTHVTVGSIFGMGLLNKQLNVGIFKNILMSWVITLPSAAAISATLYSLCVIIHR